MSRLIKSWIELGSAPDLDAATDMTPVDYVSSALIHLSLSRQALGNVFHLVNPQQIHVRDLVAWIRSAGYPIEQLSYNQWRTELLSRARRSKGRAVYSLLPLFSARTPEKPLPAGTHEQGGGQNTVDQIGSIMAAQYAAGSVKFDDQHTRDGLAGSSITCPLVDGGVLARYLSYSVRNGFLHAPDLPDEQAVGRLS
jgi:thioester reductase-like protein